MKVYLIRERKGIHASAEYDPTTKTITVLKGSILSASVSYSKKFRGSLSIERKREGIMKGNELVKDISFTSASTAANFVTGTSSNGLIAWKDNTGKTIKELIFTTEDQK